MMALASIKDVLTKMQKIMMSQPMQTMDPVNIQIQFSGVLIQMQKIIMNMQQTITERVNTNQAIMSLLQMKKLTSL